MTVEEFVGKFLVEFDNLFQLGKLGILLWASEQVAKIVHCGPTTVTPCIRRPDELTARDSE